MFVSEFFSSRAPLIELTAGLPSIFLCTGNVRAHDATIQRNKFQAQTVGTNMLLFDDEDPSGQIDPRLLSIRVP
jgi:hypothetical protein